ncbi:bifunctional metallophosphatase/5'-nucleotidase [Bacteroides sp. 51]|nr:metallophosphatase [Bacteroides sp. 51]NDV84416.1 bifunctional metallophosphatase/5'-nucleotidase [Bacteroides sp. 51]
MIKRNLLLLTLCIAITSAFAQKTLTILHTNDVHSRIEPVSPESPDPKAANKGGFLRVAAYIEKVKKETSNVLVFDCGDFSQGTPYYNMFKGEVEIKLMNTIGYDAGTIGNHEFDFGLDNMARLFKMADFPIVCANYDVKGTVLEGLVKPYIIIKKYGLKIGILGLGTKLSGMVQVSNYEGVTFQDPYKAANEAATALKKEGCDIIICLSHLGFMASAKDPICDVELVKNTRNIDIILGGHSHTFIEEPLIYKNLDGKDVYITQMGRSGIFVGRMDITVEN